jgi:hypothetical protein
MVLEKTYQIQGGMLKQFFYNHDFQYIIMNLDSGILATLDLAAEKNMEEDDNGEEG